MEFDAELSDLRRSESSNDTNHFGNLLLDRFYLVGTLYLLIACSRVVQVFPAWKQIVVGQYLIACLASSFFIVANRGSVNQVHAFACT